MKKRLILIFAVALGARLAAAIAMGLEAPPVDDAAVYDTLATHLVAGEGYTFSGQPLTFRPPVVPVLLAALYGVVGHSLAGARVLLSGLNALIVFPLYSLGKRLGGDAAGLLSALIGALFPAHVCYSPQILSDMPAALALAVATLLTLRGAAEKTVTIPLVAGVAWGLAVLTRYSLLVLLPVALVWIARDMVRRTSSISRVGLFAIGFIAAVSPWVLRNHAEFGAWILTSPKGGLSLYYANHEGATGVLSEDLAQVPGELELQRMGFTSEEQVGAVYRARAIEFIWKNPGTFLRLCWVRWMQFWKIWSPRVGILENAVSVLSFGTVLVFCLAGLARQSSRAPEALVLGVLIVLLSLVHTVYPSIVRYRLPVEPLMIAIAAPTLLEAWKSVWGRPTVDARSGPRRA